MKNRKLLYFDFVTHFGGSQRSTAQLCNRLKQFNDVCVIDAYGVCDDYIEALADYDIPTHVLVPAANMVYIGHKGKFLKRTWSLIKQIWTLLKLRRRLFNKIVEINPDIVWTNSYKALFFLVTNLQLRKYPLIYYARGWCRRSDVCYFARWLIKKADCVLAVSNPTAQALKSWSVPEEKIHVVYTVIDFDKLIKDNQKELLSSPPGIDKSFKILLPGQLIRTKGQHTAIEAANILKKKGINFVMWLCGDVKVGIGNEYQQYLQKSIQDYCLEDDVFILGIRKDIRALICLSDIVILPTYTEGFPRAIWESMILKRPVISTPVGGVTELVIDEETGLIIPVDDAKALAQGIERLMLDKALYNRIIRKAFEQMYEKFAPDKQTEALIAVLESTIKKTEEEL